MKMAIPTRTYLNVQGELSSNCKVDIAEGVLVKAYQTMVLTRRLDERMITLQRQGMISFALSSFGEEACSVASAAALSFEDWLYPQYRESGIMFWRGFTPQQYIHQMFCNKEDLILGRQMPNHFGSRALNVVQVSSPIGTQIPHAAGCAYAMKIQKENTVAVAYFGEGATSEGDFHVGLNFAAVRKAPAIFFCRNNGYAISTPASCQFISDGVAPQVIGRNITTYRVDGNDFFAIYEAVSQARQACIEGQGPVFIEAMTYRLGAHSTSDDPSVYRQEKEVLEKQLACPITRLKNFLEKQGLWDVQREKSYLDSINKEITEAIQVAKKTGRPALDSLIEDVYFEVPASLAAQYEDIQSLYHA
ncbi:2-oxoisovalerate dehydrogenase subunit alpha 2, mitochondrial [Neochlamydia sp. AcF95]|nr:2-oxoisovalerate dehydrogenase subunit alpha 2, mitochondrial [Neochlamydia sp. AcF95]